MTTKTIANQVYVARPIEDVAWDQPALFALKKMGLVGHQTTIHMSPQLGDPMVGTQRAETRGQISTSDLLVLLWSRNAEESPWTNYEIGLADAFKIPVLVFDLGPQARPLPGMLTPRLRARLNIRREESVASESIPRDEAPSSVDLSDNETARIDLSLADTWIDNLHFRNILRREGYASVWLADESGPTREFLRPVSVSVYVGDSREDLRSLLDGIRQQVAVLSRLGDDLPIVRVFHANMSDLFVDMNGKVTTVDAQKRVPDARALTVMYVVTEYADGGSLDAAYRQEMIVESDNRVFLDHFVEVCEGLQAAHAAGIVHRDIRPSNLVWFRKGQNRVKICDFSIVSQAMDLDPVTALVSGSLPYMSPEAFSVFDPGSDLPARDIYALGCTFFELYTGKPAFSIEEGRPGVLEAFRKQHTTAKRPDTVMMVPELISIHLSHLIKRMMNIDPHERPSLSEVISGIQKEKREAMQPALDINAMTEAQVPSRPEFRSAFSTNPTFRMRMLKEAQYFVWVRGDVQSSTIYKNLFGLLDACFGDTYSIAELFGQYDIVIRVWAPLNGIAVREFCSRLAQIMGDGDKNSVNVSTYDDIVHIGSRRGQLPDGLNMLDALVNLGEAQENNFTGDATRWLVEKNVFVRKEVGSLTSRRVIAYCLVRFSRVSSELERFALKTSIQNIFESGRHVDIKKYRMSIFKRSSQLVEGFHNEDADVLLKYAAPTFDGVARIPEIIQEQLLPSYVRTTTLVATNRYFVESDRVKIR